MSGTKGLPWLVRDREFYVRLATLALPMALQSVISFCVGFADNVMVATLRESAVGGVFVATQVMNVLHMLVTGLGSATVILAAQYYGKGDIRSVKTIASAIIKIAIAISALTMIAILFWGRPIFGILTDKPDVVEAAYQYGKYVAVSFLFFGVTSVILASLRCAGQVKIGLYISIATLFVNVGLNYVLIFGKLGFSQMGVQGAGIATLASRVAELCIALGYALFVDKKLQLKVRDIFLRNAKLVKSFFRYGTPVILGDIFWGIGGAAQAAIIGRLAEPVIAASAMTMNIFSIFAVFVYGASSAGSLIVGQTIGKNEFERAKQYTKTLQLVYVCVGVASGLLMMALRAPVLRFYTELEPQTLAYASQFVLVMSVMLMGTSYQMSSLQIVRAGGATHFVMVNDLIFVWCVLIPSAYIAAFVLHAPPWVVFACLKCDQILKCFVAMVKVNRFKWMKNMTIATGKAEALAE